MQKWGVVKWWRVWNIERAREEVREMVEARSLSLGTTA